MINFGHETKELEFEKRITPLPFLSVSRSIFLIVLYNLPI